MALSRKLFAIFNLFILASLMANSLFAQEELKVISTSQDPSFVRWVSEDGTITIYQRRSGSLLYSTNYSVESIIDSIPGTNYTVYSHRQSPYLLIQEDTSFLKFQNPVTPQKIYKMKIGSPKVELIGEGVSPKIHHNASMLSYYSPIENKFHLLNLENILLRFDIALSNIFPYWLPDIVAADANNWLYTDMNKDGIVGVVHLERSTKKQNLIVKSEFQNKRIELCINDTGLFLGQLTAENHEPYTQILLFPKKQLLEFKGHIIYEDKSLDRGNILCNYDDNIYFLKNTDNSNRNITEVAELNPLDKKITILTNIKHASNIFFLSDKLLTMHNGKTLVLKGRNDMKESTKLPTDIKTDKPTDSESPEKGTKE